MNTTTSFLYYNTDTNEWQQAAIETLATLNDPDLYIIPIDDQGNYGQQTTWGHFSSPEHREALKQAEAEAKQRKQAQLQEQARKEHQAQIQALQKKEKQHAQENKDTNLQQIRDTITKANIPLTCDLICYVCRLICVVFWVNLLISCVAFGYFIAGEKFRLIGIICGAVVAGLIFLVISVIINEWKDSAEKAGQ